MKQEFGKLRKVDLRSIWANEARDFTPWLARNIVELGNAVGMELEFIEREAQVGGFSADLVAKDLASDTNVVIENQFGRTDHDHLGKLITYGAGYDAYAVIWVAEEVREEHRESLDWLNERTDTDTLFFQIEVEILKIGDSKPAFNFKGVVLPNEWQKVQHREARARTTPKGTAYQQFYQPILDDLYKGRHFARKRIARPQNWCAFGSGHTGIQYGITFRNNGTACVELWVEDDEPFDLLQSRRQELEGSLKQAFAWESGDTGGRIAIRRPGSIDLPDDELAEIRHWMFQTLVEFKGAIDPVLAG